MKLRSAALFALVVMHASGFATEAMAKVTRFNKGYDIGKSGLVPKYPDDYSCSPLTSLYASWIDVDGTKRNHPHSGVDGGRRGEAILAPAAGVVVAVWKANWGWGEEGALLIRHTREDLGLEEGAKYYYSEFDHLRYDDIRSLSEGQAISRGQRLATVATPGGKSQYLPEVHWEVWEIGDDSATIWSVNRHKAKYWTNSTGRLIDPLYMMALDAPPDEDGTVEIPVYDGGRNYAEFRGFTYILPCTKKRAARAR